MKAKVIKRLQGIVASKSGLKSYKVTITQKTAHPIYKKIVSHSVSFIAHAEKDYTIGDAVEIIPVTRISKNKYYKIVESKKKKKTIKSS